MAKVMNFEIDSKSGILLATEGKYCAQNIKVVPKLKDMSFRENGSYRVPEGYAGHGIVNVQVFPKLETLEITENGTYTPSDGNYGLGEVAVNVKPALATFAVTGETRDGIYTPPEGYYGFRDVVVKHAYAEVTTEISYSSRQGYCCSFKASDFGYTGPGPLWAVITWTEYNSAIAGDGPWITYDDDGLSGAIRGMQSGECVGKTFFIIDGSTLRPVARYTTVNEVSGD